jgi:hypothetical protein
MRVRRFHDLSARTSELRRCLDEVAEVDWQHPAWWLAVAGTAALEPPDAASAPAGLNTDGSPRSDTFMARRATAPIAIAEAIATAIVRARAALEAIAALDGTLPEQPLGCALARRQGMVRRTGLDASPRVAFATSVGAFLATLATDRRADLLLAADLARLMSGRPTETTRLEYIDVRAPALTPAAVAVSVYLEQADVARHLHRRAWTLGGGPWLGVGDAPPFEVVTTSHLVVDGYGHALLADQIFAREDSAVAHRRLLLEAARSGLGGAPACTPSTVAHPCAGALPLGIAVLELEDEPSFAAAAYALGRCLEPIYRGHLSRRTRHGARFTPTFQIPVAPGQRGDPVRRRRRVVAGLMSLRMHKGVFEEFEPFAARLGPSLEREMAQRGAFARMARAALRAPLPGPIKRQLLTAGSERRGWMPLVETLAGRGCLSLLRFAPEERPRSTLFAVSSPAMLADRSDRLGGTVLTLVQTPRGMAATVSGTGLAGSRGGSQSFLENWLSELRRVS